LEAEPRAPAGRLLPHISAGWDRIAATQRRRLVCPLGARVLACVGPLWPRWGAAVGALKGRSRPPPRVQKKNQPCLGSLAPSGLCRNAFVPLFGTGVDCTFPLPVPSGRPSFGPQGLLISCPDLREKTATQLLRDMKDVFLFLSTFPGYRDAYKCSIAIFERCLRVSGFSYK